MANAAKGKRKGHGEESTRTGQQQRSAIKGKRRIRTRVNKWNSEGRWAPPPWDPGDPRREIDPGLWWNCLGGAKDDCRAFVAALYDARIGFLMAALVRRFGMKRLEDLRDAVADAFLMFLSGLLAGRIKIPLVKVVPYVLTSARLRYLALQSRARRYSSLILSEDEHPLCREPSPLAAAIETDTRSALIAHAKRVLPPCLRRVALMLMQGLGTVEIARAIGLKAESVEVYASEARRRLARHRRRFA